MSGLREAFEEIVADVPVYGDLGRALEQADRERRRRSGVVAGLAVAAVVAVIVGVLAFTGDRTDSQQPVGPSTPTPTSTTSPSPAKSQSPLTWVDTPVARHEGHGWDVPDPLKPARDAWLPMVAEHLDPQGGHLRHAKTSFFGAEFDQPVEGSIYPTYGHVQLVVDGGGPNPLDGCRYLTDGPAPSSGTESCSEERFAGPAGERATIARWGRRCGAFDGSAEAYETCGDYKVAMAVERRDGLIGYVVSDGRGTPDSNPFPPDAMAAVAADPRLTLPESAFAVPSDHDVASVTRGHFPGYRPRDTSSAPDHTGYAQAYGSVGRRLGLAVTVQPAGGDPSCGRSWLLDCVERRVFGADDTTTVFVGAWDEEHWADCCPRNSRADSRQFVYVGPHHTVVVWETMVVRAGEDPLSADLDRRLIDLALDPRLQ